MATPHDNLFHLTFADKAHAAALFRIALPPVLVEAIDWDTLCVLDCVVTDAWLKKHILDHVYSVRLKHYNLTLCLAPEHKSRRYRRPRGCVLQMLRYAMVLLEKWARENPTAPGLPPIILVLFYHGKKPWNAPTSLRDQFDLAGLLEVREKDQALAAAIEGHGVSMTVCLFDLAAIDEAWLRAAELPDEVKFVMLCMHCARFGSRAEVAAMLDRWTDLIVAVHKASEGQGKLAGIESYLAEIDKLGYKQLKDILQRTTGTGDKLMSIAQRWRKEGEARGRIATLLRQLQRRFGELPKSIEKRVQAAKVAELEIWTDRVLDAKTLDDVFAAD